MKSSNCTTLKVKILKQTAAELRELAQLEGLTVGEVLDRAILDISPTDTQVALSLILDDILMRCERLDNEEFNTVITMLAESLLAVYKEDNTGGNRARLELLLEKYRESTI